MQYGHMALTAVATVFIGNNVVNFIISSCVFTVTSARKNSNNINNNNYNNNNIHLSASTHIDLLSTNVI